jgi:hypothetical protein
MIFAALAADVPWYPNSTRRETFAGDAPERAQSDRNARVRSRVTSHTQGGACNVFEARRVTPCPCFVPYERVKRACDVVQSVFHEDKIGR